MLVRRQLTLNCLFTNLPQKLFKMTSRFQLSFAGNVIERGASRRQLLQIPSNNYHFLAGSFGQTLPGFNPGNQFEVTDWWHSDHSHPVIFMEFISVLWAYWCRARGFMSTLKGYTIRLSQSDPATLPGLHCDHFLLFTSKSGTNLANYIIPGSLASPISQGFSDFRTLCLVDWNETEAILRTGIRINLLVLLVG